jgi:rod shape-determining protein MreC
MPLGTLDRTPPPFFKQGPSALSKLVVFSALALFLMVADLRFSFVAPFRSVLATTLHPMQWLLMRPVEAVTELNDYLKTVQVVREGESQTMQRLVAQAGRAQQVEQLELENRRLRQLLAIRERISTPVTGAQVLYDAADPFSRKVVIDRGQAHGIQPGSPVIDEFGVLGQVTRVYPLVSEVTLLVDRDQSIPVLNARTGVRNVAYGQTSSTGDGMELRFTLANADVQEGDLLTTSGIDGVYPPGLAVARVNLVERRAESSFTRIGCAPLARVHGALHVLVLAPVGTQLPPSPLPRVSANATPSADSPAETRRGNP